MAPKNFEIQNEEIGTRNLFVIKAMQSLTSRGYVKTQFSWQYYYYTLLPEGLDYLREWLHLPAEIVPATHIKQQRSHAPPRGMMGEGEREREPELDEAERLQPCTANLSSDLDIPRIAMRLNRQDTPR